MGFWEILITAIALSMDAFAVSVCKGLATEKVEIKHMALTGAWFGGFQALMPLIGYFLGAAFKDFITAVDHWIAFALLGFLGVNMLREALGKDDDDCGCDECDAAMDVKTMFTMAVATSIDALAVGVTFAFLKVQIVPAVSFIGIVTFVMSFIGVKVGSIFGAKFKKKAEFFGGAVLVLMGIKILLEHLGVIG